MVVHEPSERVDELERELQRIRGQVRRARSVEAVVLTALLLILGLVLRRGDALSAGATAPRPPMARTSPAGTAQPQAQLVPAVPPRERGNADGALLVR
jgi:hypothetical protein